MHSHCGRWESMQAGSIWSPCTGMQRKGGHEAAGSHACAGP